MTTTEAEKVISILQAFVERKVIQVRGIKPDTRWVDADESDLDLIGKVKNAEWRIKPEPREFWIQQCKESTETMLFAYRQKPKPSETDWEIIHVREVME